MQKHLGLFSHFIQKLHDLFYNTATDGGLGRIGLFIFLYNFFIFFVTTVFFQKLLFQAIIVGASALLILLGINHIKKLEKQQILILQSLFLPLFMWVDYDLIGAIDKYFIAPKRYDVFFQSVDLFIWKGAASNVLVHFFQKIFGSLTAYFFDLLMMAYSIFYVWIFVGLWFIFLFRKKTYLEDSTRYLSSVVIYFIINFTLYMIFPVTGPQYFYQHLFIGDIPASVVGQTLFAFIKGLQSNYIDCFPSGHVGMSFLVAIWMMKLKLKLSSVALTSAILTTVAILTLRFHYTLDFIFALPITYFSYKIANSSLFKIKDV